MITFKTRGLQIQWQNPKDQDLYLRLLVQESACWLAQRGETLVVVSLYREGGGPHGGKPCRGADIRTKGIDDELIEELEDHLNGTLPWPINPETGRPYCPTACFERKGQVSRRGGRAATDDHLHLQSPLPALGDTGWAPVLSPWDPETRGLL